MRMPRWSGPEPSRPHRRQAKSRSAAIKANFIETVRDGCEIPLAFYPKMMASDHAALESSKSGETAVRASCSRNSRGSFGTIVGSNPTRNAALKVRASRCLSHIPTWTKARVRILIPSFPALIPPVLRHSRRPISRRISPTFIHSSIIFIRFATENLLCDRRGGRASTPEITKARCATAPRSSLRCRRIQRPCSSKAALYSRSRAAKARATFEELARTREFRSQL